MINILKANIEKKYYLGKINIFNINKIIIN